MISNNLKRLYQLSIVASLLILSANSYAYGPIMRALEHTIEGARITVHVENTRNSGTVTAQLLDCNGCIPKVYVFDSSTVFINALGAKKPINELVTWSGSVAMLSYRLDDNHIQEIKILP
jgi:hypothetical protein